MSTHHQEPEESTAQRKQRLLEQCKAYRVAIGEARNVAVSYTHLTLPTSDLV